MSACPECDGGLRLVLEPYVESHTPPWPDAPPVDATPEVQRAYEARVVEVAAKKAAAANTAYPCKTCNPKAFWRWVGGCYKPDHDPAGCELCQAANEPRRRRSDPSGYRLTHDQPPGPSPAAPAPGTPPAEDPF